MKTQTVITMSARHVTIVFVLLIQGAAPLGGARAGETFDQDVVTRFAVRDGLPDADVAAVALDERGRPTAATRAGLARFDGASWAAIDSPTFAVVRLTFSRDRLWALGRRRLARRDATGWVDVGEFRDEGAESVAVSLTPTGVGVAVGVGQSVHFVSAGRAMVKPLELPSAVLAVAATSRRLYVGTTSGLFAATGSDSEGWTYEHLLPADTRRSWVPRDVAAVVATDDGLWFGAREGAGKLRNGAWNLYTGDEGLPYNQFTCAATGPNGTVWFGTTRGAFRYDGKRWRYRARDRWLADDRVSDIAVAPNGTAWIATPKGVSRIERREMTLARKAQHFEAIVDQRHRRLDFVVRCVLEEPGNLEKTYIRDTDNDGLYTATYGASQTFRYAATRESVAKERAKRCFRALKSLVDITPMSGFPARSILPVDGREDPNIRFDVEYNRRHKERDPYWKEILPRWPKSADGKYWWKCDTSSDEICGHYFFFAAYYDHVAETDEERAEVRALVRAMTDHIIEGGYRLIDHDGLPTRWANWSPEYVNSARGWADRGLQAVEILSFLNVALHITGDDKYAAAAAYLRDEHAYHIVAITGRAVFPPRHVVAWDNNLAFLSYYGLVKYESDPKLRRIYESSLDRNWLFVSRQNDPFFNFVYAALRSPAPSLIFRQGEPDRERLLANAVRTLRDTPWLLIGWEMKNSHRLDIALDPTPGQRPGYGWSRSGDAIPVDERSHIRINSDHFALDHGQGSGRSEYEGSFYLLPYYMGRHYGFLAK